MLLTTSNFNEFSGQRQNIRAIDSEIKYPLHLRAHWIDSKFKFEHDQLCEESAVSLLIHDQLCEESSVSSALRSKKTEVINDKCTDVGTILKALNGLKFWFHKRAIIIWTCLGNE